MPGTTILNHLRLQQGPLVLLSLMGLGIVLLGTLLSRQWILAAATIAATVLILFSSWSGLVLWQRIGHALRYHQDGHQTHADGAAGIAWQSAESLGAADPRRALLLELWAAIKRAQGDYTQAESLYQQAVAVQELAWGANHPRALAALSRLADAYIDIARFAEAEPVIRRVLAACEQASPGGLALAQSLHQCGRLYVEQRRFAEAEPYARRALEIVEARLRDRSDRLWCLCILQVGAIAIHQGRLEEAESVLEPAVAELEGCLGTEHPRVGQSLQWLALLRLRQGRLAEAEQLQRRGLGILGRQLGGEHPALAPGLNQLAEVLAAQGRVEDAESFCRRALELRDEYLAPDHPALADSLETYAELLERTDRAMEARSYRERADQVRTAAASLRSA